jgi:hypothetical protein
MTGDKRFVWHPVVQPREPFKPDMRPQAHFDSDTLVPLPCSPVAIVRFGCFTTESCQRSVRWRKLTFGAEAIRTDHLVKEAKRTPVFRKHRGSKDRGAGNGSDKWDVSNPE